MIDRERMQSLISGMLTGRMPKEADISVVNVLAMDGPGSDEDWVSVLAEYYWDHWMGEPEEISPETIAEGIWMYQSMVECGCGLGYEHFYVDLKV